MAVFEYKGFDAAGTEVAGIVDADSAKSARSKLRRQDVFTTDVWAQKAGKATRGKGLNIEIDFSKYFQRIKPGDIATMTSQLATLISAGIPMVEALSALIDQVEAPALKLVLVEVRENVNQGDGLAKSLRKHPKVFDNLYVNMVAAGEQSGALDIVLERLTTYTENSVKLRGKVTSAMMYPMLMGGVSVLIIAGLFIGVIPRIRRIFESFGEALPPLTRLVLGMSDFIQGWWWAIILAVFGIIYGFRRYIRTKNGRKRWHKLLITMPLFGRVNRLVAVSRFCRTLSTLLDSGVPILTAVEIVRKVVGNDILAVAIENAGRNIREGQSIAGPLKESGEFPPLVTHMIAIGEKTGDLEPMLAKVSDSYDQQVENTLSGLTSLLEPLLILVMGGGVAIVALSILQPMLNMSSIAR
jgi:general secretion pathway protein F